MAVQKTVKIDGQSVTFKASAATPRIYRNRFGRDFFADISWLMSAMQQSEAEQSTLDIVSLEAFENIAFIMAKDADPEVPDTPDEWLERFNTFSIYQIMPHIVKLWGLNNRTTAEAKKNGKAASSAT